MVRARRAAHGPGRRGAGFPRTFLWQEPRWYPLPERVPSRREIIERLTARLADIQLLSRHRSILTMVQPSFGLEFSIKYTPALQATRDATEDGDEAATLHVRATMNDGVLDRLEVE